MAFVDKSYRDRNYNSPNPLRRYAHRSRFKKSIESISTHEGASVMDFGAGDGLFLNQLYGTNQEMTLVGFEPYMESIKENTIQIETQWSRIEMISNEIGKFDFVTCFEVLEHFSPENQYEALRKMHSIVKESGKIILSVPIEKGMPALVKNIIRRVNLPHSNHIFTYDNILKSLSGASLLHLRNDPGYLSHMGFYFTDLENEIEKLFDIRMKSYSPIGGPTYQTNSQVFYELIKKG